MHIRFSFSWIKSGALSQKAFKSQATYSLFAEYAGRIRHFVPCEVGPYRVQTKTLLWVCEREKEGKMLSSPGLARELQKSMNAGAQGLQIVVGGPDGFTAQEIKAMSPDFLWSFGPMTFPHELAAVVAAEQIYRAFTILRNLPYHAGH